VINVSAGAAWLLRHPASTCTSPEQLMLSGRRPRQTRSSRLSPRPPAVAQRDVYGRTWAGQTRSCEGTRWRRLRYPLRAADHSARRGV